MYPAAFKNEDELRGTLAHEDMHATFDNVLGKYNAQKEQVVSGKVSLQSEEASAYRELKSMFTEKATYSTAGGVTLYSQMFWNKYNESKSTDNYVMAVNETLAECSRLIVSGKQDEIPPQWRAAYRRVRTAGKQGAKS
jgi:hypothetical protein